MPLRDLGAGCAGGLECFNRVRDFDVRRPQVRCRRSLAVPGSLLGAFDVLGFGLGDGGLSSRGTGLAASGSGCEPGDERPRNAGAALQRVGFRA